MSMDHKLSQSNLYYQPVGESAEKNLRFIKRNHYKCGCHRAYLPAAQHTQEASITQDLVLLFEGSDYRSRQSSLVRRYNVHTHAP